LTRRKSGRRPMTAWTTPASWYYRVVILSTARSFVDGGQYTRQRAGGQPPRAGNWRTAGNRNSRVHDDGAVSQIGQSGRPAPVGGRAAALHLREARGLICLEHGVRAEDAVRLRQCSV